MGKCSDSACCRGVNRYWEGNNQKACFLHCLPLAITPLFISIMFFFMGGIAIAGKVLVTHADGKSWNGAAISVVCVNILQIILGFLGFFVVWKKFKALRSLKILKISYLVVCLSMVIVQTIVIIIYAVDGHANTNTMIYTGCYLGYGVLLMGFSYEINSCTSSLRKVYTMGGTGWERANAAKISTLHKMRQVSDEAQIENLVGAESDI